MCRVIIHLITVNCAIENKVYITFQSTLMLIISVSFVTLLITELT